MADFDLIFRSGTVENEVTDVAVKDGLIAAIGPDLSGSTELEIQLEELSLFPGFIDAHVHFNEPGRTEWEGFATGSRALAAGGGTVFCDMPLNSTPPVVDPASFEQKRETGEKKSYVDFGLWGGLVPGNSDQIPGMAEAGAMGLKAFMADSGLDEFPWVTPSDLKDGMEVAAEYRIPVGVHAESQEFLDRMPKMTGRGARDFLDSRPIAAEVEAIRIACELAGETGCRLHVVHVSSAEGIREIQAAKDRGVDVSAETCPHYLFLCEDDMIELGAVAKCAPPLRTSDDVATLICCLESGEIDTIGSDHSPCLPEMKTGDFIDAWGGISSCQHAFPTFLAGFPHLSKLLTSNPADRFGLSERKGSIEVGKDADFAVVDFREKETVDSSSLRYRHPVSPYMGRRINCRVKMAFCRGRMIHGDGAADKPPGGQFVAAKHS